MQIQQLRNATILVTVGEHRLLVDPMLSPAGAMPSFRVRGGSRRRNPLVPLPPETTAALDEVTAVVVTHEHPDHFDRAGREWVASHQLPVWTSAIDAPSLRRKGLDVHELRDGSLGMRVEIIRSRHGQGLLGWLMGPVCGYYLAHPDEPSVYLVGDSVLTPSVLEAIERLQPDVIVVPAGAANMGVGGDILFSVDDLVTLVRASRGVVVLNHLEALDHCPTTRGALAARMEAEGLGARVRIPADGERVAFSRSDRGANVEVRATARAKPGVQKWVTALLA
jgi:L-ascorbate metabolism protein UlaG (beta-lactamase superfamily)